MRQRPVKVNSHLPFFIDTFSNFLLKSIRSGVMYDLGSGDQHDQKGLSPRRASRAMGAWKTKRPPSRGSNQGKAASQSAPRLGARLTVGQPAPQAGEIAFAAE